MKKAISLLLALVMCLSLCACGNKDTETPTENASNNSEADSALLGQWVSVEDRKLFFMFTDDKEGTASNREREAPIKWFYDAEANNYVITVLDEDTFSIRLETMDGFDCFTYDAHTFIRIDEYDAFMAKNTEPAETEPTETEPVETEPTYTTIEISLDNWQEYFELRLCVSEQRNDFDELTCIYPELTLFLKEEWATIATDMDVAVEYSCTDGYYCQFSYNVETGEMIEGEPVDRNFGGTDDTGTFKMGDYHIEAGYEIVEGIAGNSFTLDGNIASVHRRMYKNVEIVRIQGTITIAE